MVITNLCTHLKNWDGLNFRVHKAGPWEEGTSHKVRAHFLLCCIHHSELCLTAGKKTLMWNDHRYTSSANKPYMSLTQSMVVICIVRNLQMEQHACRNNHSTAYSLAYVYLCYYLSKCLLWKIPFWSKSKILEKKNIPTWLSSFFPSFLIILQRARAPKTIASCSHCHISMHSGTTPFPSPPAAYGAKRKNFLSGQPACDHDLCSTVSNV